MTKIYCENCGSNQLEERGDTYYCPHCHTVWRKHEIDEIYDKLASILDEQKQERVANLRRQLYDALCDDEQGGGEYGRPLKIIDLNEVARLCNGIKSYLPDDFQAKFFYIAAKGSPDKVARTLCNINPRLHMGYVPQIMDFMLNVAQYVHLAAMNDFLDRAYGNGQDKERFNFYNEKLQQKAQEISRGMYDPSIPRDVFVAYSGRDRRKMLELVEALEGAGLSCFVALRNLQHFKTENTLYNQKLQTAMDSCKVVVLVSSVMSRTDSDAYRIELPYVKKCDLQAHPEYQNCYERMPEKFKKPRVEYVIEEHKGLPAERFSEEFFSGYERVSTLEQVVNAVYDIKNMVVLDDQPKKKDVKYCAACGTECKLSFKLCPECGNKEFVSTHEEYIEAKAKREKDEEIARAKREKDEEIAKVRAEMQAQIDALKKAEDDRKAEEARKAKEAEDRKIKEEEAARKAEEESERKAKEEAARKAEEVRRSAKPYTTIDDEHIAFGHYPQSKVTDGNLIATLNRMAGSTPSASNSAGWTDYKYYIDKKVQSFMWYKDVNYGGEKYRAVYFDKWRLGWTSSSSEGNTYQGKNGYKLKTIYWFKWEPIKWKILQKSDGELTLFSDMLLDSQHYYRNYNSRTTNGKTIYPNNYAQSDIRAWLNNDFLSAAFDAQEKNLIKTTLVDNSAATTQNSSNKYACENTYDKIYLLSYQDAWDISDADRKRKTTDYARAQGADTNTGGGYTGYWWLRSPNCYCYYRALHVYYAGDVLSDGVSYTSGGVAPALRITI